MPADTAPAWPDPDTTVPEALFNATGLVLGREQERALKIWLAAREAAAWAAGAEAMKQIAFDAGREQGSDESVAFEWGSRPALTYAEALAAVEIPPAPAQHGGAGDE